MRLNTSICRRSRRGGRYRVLGSPRPRRARQAKPPGATPTPTLEERITEPRRATGPKTVRACGRLAWQRQHEVAAQRREGRASDAYAAAAGGLSAQVRHRHRPLHRPQRLHKVPPDPGEPPCRVTVDDARSPGQSDCLIPPGPLASLRTQPARPPTRARLCGAASSAPLPAVTRSNPVPACDSGSSLHTHGRLGLGAVGHTRRRRAEPDIAGDRGCGGRGTGRCWFGTCPAPSSSWYPARA
jgi:hypothetical protein